MKIYGLQKLTLLDFPERVACTVFLGGCDLRCPFCHNFELVDGLLPPVMDSDELLDFLRGRQKLLDGVVITGGEPCLHTDLPDLMGEIRALGYQIKLDTNGFHPEMLRRALDGGLVDYVAMDIKNSPAGYAKTAGLASVDLGPLMESIAMLKEWGASDTGCPPETGAAGSPAAGSFAAGSLAAETVSSDYEFRTTVVSEFHGAADFEEIGKMIAGAPHYYLQSFVDRDTVPRKGLHAPSAEEMEQYAAIARQYVPDTRIRGMDV